MDMSGPEQVRETLAQLARSNRGAPYAKLCRTALSMYEAAGETGDESLQDLCAEMLKILARFAFQSWTRKLTDLRYRQ